MAMEGTGETDSLAEQRRFELLVPYQGKSPFLVPLKAILVPLKAILVDLSPYLPAKKASLRSGTKSSNPSRSSGQSFLSDGAAAHRRFD